MKPIRIKKPIQDVAKPATQPWDRYQFIEDPVERQRTWEKVCEKQEIDNHREQVLALTALHEELRAQRSFEAWFVLQKLDRLRKVELKRGWVTMPWEVKHVV